MNPPLSLNGSWSFLVGEFSRRLVRFGNAASAFHLPHGGVLV